MVGLEGLADTPFDPPTYSQWARRRNRRKRMIWMKINGGPGRTRTFDLPIMLRLVLNVVCPLLFVNH